MSRTPRKLFAQHRQGLEQGLLVGGEPVDAGGQHPLHRGRQLQGGEGAARHGRHQLHPAGGSRRSTPWSTRVWTISSMKKGFPAVFARMKCLRRLQGRAVSQQRREQRVRLLRPQRIEPQLGVVGFAAPAVLVLGPVIHQQQEAGGGDPVAEEVSQACVSLSSQCRSSTSRSTGWFRLSRSSSRVMASKVRRRRSCGSTCASAAAASSTPTRAET